MDTLLERPCRKAFLDLSLDGTYLGQIIIRVMDEGYKALNFLHMCSGDMGPSYANSKISGVTFKGKDREFVVMGENSVEGGTSSKAVLSGVHWLKEFEREIYVGAPMKAGQVLGVFLDDLASVFRIITRDDPSCTRRIGSCFGTVVEGLDVLKDVIDSNQDITKVKVTDCGLVFSL